MKNYFQFKQFSIRQDRCAMKVGTDGVLLGAWGCVEGRRILDIGTGTGLIALMAAQRNPEATVLGIDIDEEAVRQARENIAESPFCERVRCELLDAMELRPTEWASGQCEQGFDAILCNPPFFTEDTLPEDKGRAMARNNRSMPFAELVPKVASLLREGGSFSVIIPSQLATDFISLCLAENLHLQRRCQVRTTAKKPPRRVLLCFAKGNGHRTSDDVQEMCLLADDGSRSQAYMALTKDFYL